MFTSCLAPEHAFTFTGSENYWAGNIPYSHLGKRKETFQWQTNIQLQACSVPGACVSEAFYTSLLFFLGEFSQGAGTPLTSDWTALLKAEGKLKSSGGSLNAHPVSVSWVWAKKTHKLILSPPISSPYHRGAMALAFYCFPTGLKKNKEDSVVP